jgi:GTPase involved in cell partitioning and DNA repair
MILRGQRKDGSLFPVEISLSYYETEEGLYVIAFIIDITDRHEQQEKISKINNELRLLNETLEKKVTERTLVLKEALTELEKSRDELTNALEKEKELNENIKALEKNIELIDGVEMKNKILEKVAAISNQEKDLEML